MKKHAEETTSYILKYNYVQMPKNIQVHRWKNSNLSTTQSASDLKSLEKYATFDSKLRSYIV